MGCGASSPQQPGEAPVTRVFPAGQAVSEADTAPSSARRSGEVGPIIVKSVAHKNAPGILEKIGSLSERAAPEQVLQSLLDGNVRFIEGKSSHPHQDFARVQQVSEKQKPLVAILGCADSRVPAEIIFDQGFGDVFCCRVAGNIATPEQLASLEYAVLDVGVKVVMILGHTRCGAVKAALSGKAFPGFIDTLVDHLDVAIARVDSMNAKAYKAARDNSPEFADRVVRENVKYQVQRCQRSTIIQEGLQKGTLLVVGAVYNLDTGRVNITITKGGAAGEQ